MLSVLIWLNLFLPAQEKVQINMPHDFFEVDHFGNIYTVHDSEIVKFNAKGEKGPSCSNSMSGSISSLDVTDPLRMLVFYKDFNQCVYLDRNLAKIGDEIDLYDFSDNEISFVCTSLKGGFWIYDPVENQAIHISARGEILNRSTVLSSFWEEVLPSKMIEHDNKLYLLFKNKGVLNLDLNGQFLKKISIPEIEDFNFSGTALYYTNRCCIFEFKPYGQADPMLYGIHSATEEMFLKAANGKIYTSRGNLITIRSKPLK